jgi:hypothetical protein
MVWDGKLKPFFGDEFTAHLITGPSYLRVQRLSVAIGEFRCL